MKADAFSRVLRNPKSLSSTAVCSQMLSYGGRLQAMQKSVAIFSDRAMREMSDILSEMVRVKLMWELWECGGKREVYDVVHDEATVINPRPSFNYPWRGQMSRAARAVRHVEKLQRALESGRYESGISDHGSFFGVTVHVPTLRRDLIRRAQWHREWYEYGKSLRKVTATVKSSP